MHSNASNSEYGAFFKYLESSSAHKNTVRQIKQTLNIDEDFHAVRNLVDILLPLLESGNRSELQQAWLRALTEIKRNGIAKKWGLLPPSGRGGNPLGGQFSKYPISSMLLQPLDPRISKQAQGLIQLFLSSLLCNIEKNHAELAHELRKSFTKSLTLIEQLPAYASFQDYSIELRSKLAEAQSKQHDKSTSALLNLAKNLLNSTQQTFNEPTAVKPTALVVKTPPIAFISRVVSTIDPPDYGYVTPFKIGPAPEYGVEAPGSVQVFVSTEIIDDDDLLPTEEEVDTQARLSSFWIQRQQSLVPTDTGRFTAIEKQHFVSFIKEGLSSHNAAERMSAGLLGVMYVTGQNLEQVLDCSMGSMQTFSSDGLYRRAIKQPVDAYKPKIKALSSLMPAAVSIALRLPEPIHSWVKSFCNDTQIQTFSQSLGLTLDEAQKLVQAALKQLRDNGRFQRLRLERIPAALAIELTLAFRDSVITFLLSSTSNHAPSMLSYYVVHDVGYLEKCYESATQKMLQAPGITLPIKNEGISKNYPTAAAIKSLIEGLSSNVSAAKKQGILAATHNAYTDFCLALLFCATGHRAVADPFDSRRLFDLETRTLLISDKVIEESRAWRLVSLAEIATVQIKAYDSYLPKLAAHLADTPESGELVAKISGLTQGYEPIPYFFYLDENQLGKVRRITVSELNKRWSAYWPMPIGMLRHITATELKRQSGRTDWVAIQLGHSTGMSHVFGKASTLPVLETLRKISACTDIYMQQLGWKNVNSPLRMPSISLTNMVIQKRASVAFGSSERSALRQEASQRRSLLVKKSIDLVLQQEKALPTPDQFHKIIENLITEAAQEKSNANSYIKLFYRYIGMQRGGKDLLRRLPRIRQLEYEPSPFNERSLIDYRELLQIRSAFIKMLEEKGRHKESFELEERIGQIIFSAALFGGIANKERLEQLKTAIIKHTYQLQDFIFVDISLFATEPAPVFRWFPDSLSKLLIIGLFRSKLTEQDASLKKTHDYIKKIGDHLNIDTKDILAKLEFMSSTALLFEVPGYIRSCLRGETPAVSLGLSAFVRVVTDTALVSEPDLIKNSDLDGSWSPAIGQHIKSSSADRSFIKLLRKKFTDSKTIESKGNKLISKKIKEALIKNLKQEFNNSVKTTSLHAAVVAWAVYLSSKGTRFKTILKPRTIENYVFLIANSLLSSVIQNDFLSCDESGFEEIYLRTIESADTNRRFDLVSRLREFHSFLIDNYEADDIEWSAIYAAAGIFVEPTFADANFISECEYLDVLASISSDETLSEQLSIQYSILIFFGYRFGLRFGEALKVQYKDIQYNNENFSIWIHNSIFGETKSPAGVRIVLLLEKLSTIEISIIEKAFNYAAECFAEDTQAALASQDANSREMIDRYSAASYISKQLKSITGDNSIRFHHLRHSWATRIFITLNTDKDPVIFKQFSSSEYNQEQIIEFIGTTEEAYPLRSLMTAIGHSNESTTLASYVHSIDQISMIAFDSANRNNLNNLVQSYALKRSTDDLRQRKSRGLNNNVDDSIPCPNIKTKSREREYKETILSTHEKISLNNIDLILRRFSNSQNDLSKSKQNINKISNRLFIDPIQVEKIVQVATSIERVSGFTCYKLYKKTDDPIVKSGTQGQDRNLLKRENTRIKEILTSVNSHLSRLSDDETELIRNGLRVWMKTYNKIGFNIISDFKELNDLISALKSLNLDIEMKIIIQDDTSVDTVLELSKLNISFLKTKNLPLSFEKTNVRRSGRVGLKIEENKNIGPRRTLLRVLTIVNVWISL